MLNNIRYNKPRHVITFQERRVIKNEYRTTVHLLYFHENNEFQ
jgi:hypothetical protein